jgi:hypothetical protein
LILQELILLPPSFRHGLLNEKLSSYLPLHAMNASDGRAFSIEGVSLRGFTAQDHDHHLASLLRDAPAAGLLVRRLSFEARASVEHSVELLELRLNEEKAAVGGILAEPFLGLD